MMGGSGVEARKKAKATVIAVKSITLAPHPDHGHQTVVVTVANIGKRDADGFRIGMVATRGSGAVSAEELSPPLNAAKGATRTVEFRVGCDVINGSRVVARTNPNPVPDESARKAANNILTQTFSDACPEL